MSTKKQLNGPPEVHAKGVTPKAKRDAGKKPTVTVTHKTELRGKHWLRNFVAGVLIVDAIAGSISIYAGLDDPAEAVARTNALWTFLGAHAMAVGTVLFTKWE